MTSTFTRRAASAFFKLAVFLHIRRPKTVGLTSIGKITNGDLEGVEIQLFGDDFWTAGVRAQIREDRDKQKTP